MSRTALRVLGVMTGTSCDGLDSSCIATDGTAGKLSGPRR